MDEDFDISTLIFLETFLSTEAITYPKNTISRACLENALKVIRKKLDKFREVSDGND